MDRLNRILVFAQPGHRRQSLVALLKTLPRTELFLVENDPGMAVQPPNLVLVDLNSLHPSVVEALKHAAQEWPTARRLALVDDIRHVGPAFALGADCVLPHNTSAGELLLAVQQYSQEAQATYRTSVNPPAFVAI